MFKINVSRIEDHTFILYLKGELTAATSLVFHQALIPIMKKRPKAISINLSNLDSIDEAGISLLMNGVMGTTQQGTYFYLIGLPNKVKEYYRSRSAEMGHSYFSMNTH